MNLLDIMKKRRSIRQYTSDPIPSDTLMQILEAGLLSPSSRGRRPWEFLVIEDKDMLKKISGCRVGSAKMLEHAAAAILVLADPLTSDVWIEDCSIAMAQMHLMADSLGIGSCWIQARLRKAPDGSPTTEYLRRLLHFPDHFEAEAILSLGIPEQHPEPHEISEELKTKIHFEK